MIGAIGRRGALLLAGLAAAAAVLLPGRPAAAHSLDEFLQSSYLTIGPDRIEVELNLSVGVLAAPTLLEVLDADGDETISDAEARDYAAAVVADQVLLVDGEPVPLRLDSVEPVSYLAVQAGYGTITAVALPASPLSLAVGDHRVEFRNDFAATNPEYQVNAFSADPAEIGLGSQRRSDDQRSLEMTFSVVSSAKVTSASVGTSRQLSAGAATTDGIGRLVDALADPSASWLAMAAALGLAAVLGAFHALTPGHGKTLVAAYLVGDRGTSRHAVLLGAVVTATHTASVVVIGVLALFASRFVVPDVLVPTLQIVSGGLVVVLGGRLLVRRLGARRPRPHGHDHPHVHTHDHDHTHEHDHGGGTHSHAVPERLSVGGLVAMGVSGGLVPCPEALGIMVIAVGVNRIALGLGLIVSFSLGLAAVLIAIGLVLVRSRSLVERVGLAERRWTRVLPVVSAVVVVTLGLALTAQGVGKLG